jgi:sugar phosphate permease
LLAETLQWTLGLYVVGYILLVSTQGAAYSMIQAAVKPTERGTASAVGSLLANLLGYAIGPALIGVMSDGWADDYGAMSLSYAVMVTAVVSLIVSVCLFWWTSMAMTDQPSALALQQ